MLKFKTNHIAVLLLCVILLAVAPYMTYAEQDDVKPETEISVPYTAVLNCGISLEIPGELANSFVHLQKVHFTPITEVFSVLISEEEIPLYRIDFGNEAVGEWLGVIRMKECDVPVTYTIYPLSDEKIAAMDEESLDSYYGAMDTFNLVMEAIQADSRFATQYAIGVGRIRKLALEHWTLMLPEGIVCEETNEDGVYTAAFYGRIHGEKIELYTVSIGGDATDAMGTFNFAGEEKPLSVKINQLGPNVFWTDVDFETAYQMLETINDVMDVIYSGGEFNSLP